MQLRERESPGPFGTGAWTQVACFPGRSLGGLKQLLTPSLSRRLQSRPAIEAFGYSTRTEGPTWAAIDPSRSRLSNVGFS